MNSWSYQGIYEQSLHGPDVGKVTAIARPVWWYFPHAPAQLFGYDPARHRTTRPTDFNRCWLLRYYRPSSSSSLNQHRVGQRRGARLTGINLLRRRLQQVRNCQRRVSEVIELNWKKALRDRTSMFAHRRADDCLVSSRQRPPPSTDMEGERKGVEARGNICI